MTNKEIVKNFFIESYQNHNYNFAMDFISEDYIDHNPAGAIGNKAAVEILKIVETMFSDLTVEIIHLFSEDNMVGAHVRFHGIHLGTCVGVPTTGKQI